MGVMDDPNDRRRIDREAMNERDVGMARLRRAKVPFRVIAERKGMSLGAVQKAHARALKAEEEARREELDSIVAYDDGGPYCEDVTDPAQVPLLTDLELYRLRFLPAGHPARRGCCGGCGGLAVAGVAADCVPGRGRCVAQWC